MEPTGKTSENWKIYCTKLLKVAATERLLIIVAKVDQVVEQRDAN